MQGEKCDDNGSVQRAGFTHAKRNYTERKEHLFDSFQAYSIYEIKSGV